MDNSNYLNQEFISKMENNREDLFGSFEKRINDKNESIKKEEEKESIRETKQIKNLRKQTELLFNSVLALIYRVLTCSEQKRGDLDTYMVDPIIGNPRSSKIFDKDTSYYYYDNNGLTICLNFTKYGNEDVSCNIGNKLFDVDYFRELEERFGVVCERMTKKIPNKYGEFFGIDTYIDIITIKFLRRNKKESLVEDNTSQNDYDPTLMRTFF